MSEFAKDKDVPVKNVGNMSDIISRQAAIEAAERESAKDGAYGYMDTKSIVDMLNDLPKRTEVVRCKDCEFYTADELWCRRLGLCGAFDPDDFCSHAERREDEAN